MKILYLLRHAKAEPGAATLFDEKRPLAERGREASAEVGTYMKDKSYIPQSVICSPSTRTRETWALIKPMLEKVEESFPAKLYLAETPEILRQIQATSDAAESLLVVGHNPGMHHIAVTLAKDAQTDLRHKLDMKFPTGALAVLRFPVRHWHEIVPHTGEIIDFIFPKDL